MKHVDVQYHPANSMPVPDLLPEAAGQFNEETDKSKFPLLLIVDDNDDFRLFMEYSLGLQYRVKLASNGKEAWDILQNSEEMPDLVVSDIMMPEMSGTESCSAIREFSSVPVLFLTAKTQEPDKNEAYDTGGDDFLSKPFEQSELVRKVKALIRRYNIYKGREDNNDGILRVGAISIDPYKRVVTKDNEVIHLTDKEFALLFFLVKNRGRSWNLDELYENIWQEKYLPSSSNTVMVHVLRLRQKIEDNPAQPEIIRTIYGKGYQVD